MINFIPDDTMIVPPYVPEAKPSGNPITTYWVDTLHDRQPCPTPEGMPTRSCPELDLFPPAQH